ncbi:MAG TPA: hypothetical protein PLF31_00855 [Candidatus Paceibacterota bacterium]|nr:hypothetical protein [Candidatus Paceibacterota bacterium]
MYIAWILVAVLFVLLVLVVIYIRKINGKNTELETKYHQARYAVINVFLETLQTASNGSSDPLNHPTHFHVVDKLVKQLTNFDKRHLSATLINYNLTIPTLEKRLVFVLLPENKKAA